MCQINNYKNALPTGRLIPIVSNYPNEIVTLDLLGPYPVSRKEKPKGRDGSTHHKRLKSETKRGEKRGVPTDHREEDTTRKTSSIQKKQRKER
ncbi:hypothetical protein TNCV_4773291 [Trichonephila clavipes]|nr:hypothetical protein TNCV_4773291 [Trichonephila clavipes]